MAGDCPRPDKIKHRSRGAANSALLSLWLKEESISERLTMTVYECACGSWHTGHKPGSRGHPVA